LVKPRNADLPIDSRAGRHDPDNVQSRHKFLTENQAFKCMTKLGPKWGEI